MNFPWIYEQTGLSIRFILTTKIYSSTSDSFLEAFVSSVLSIRYRRWFSAGSRYSKVAEVNFTNHISGLSYIS